MIRLFQIVVLSCVGLVLTGCGGGKKDEPIWQKVKIGDIAPSQAGKRPGSQLLKTINLRAFVFEVPAENIGALDDIWLMLYREPLQFNDSEAFGANSFLIGFGQVRMWSKVRELLDAAGGKKIETVSLLLFDGQVRDLTVASLEKEQTAFYISAGGSMEGVTIGPGRLSLRIQAEKIPGFRGVCKVSATPAFPSPIDSGVPQLAARGKLREFVFTCCGFGLKMSPGDFVLLWPEEYLNHRITLGSLFFSRPGEKATVRVILLVCTRIND